MDIKSFLELLKTENSNKLICQSIRTIIPAKSRLNLYMVILLIFAFISVFIINNTNTTSILIEMSIDFLSIALALLGVSLTVFALLQVTLTDDTLKFFFAHSEKTNLFVDSSLHILGIIVYYIFLLIINFMAKYCLTIYIDIASNYFIDYIYANNIIKLMLVNIYILVNIHGILEFISVVNNIFSLFIMDNIKRMYKKKQE